MHMSCTACEKRRLLDSDASAPVLPWHQASLLPGAFRKRSTVQHMSRLASLSHSTGFLTVSHCRRAGGAAEGGVAEQGGALQDRVRAHTRGHAPVGPLHFQAQVPSLSPCTCSNACMQHMFNMSYTMQSMSSWRRACARGASTSPSPGALALVQPVCTHARPVRALNWTMPKRGRPVEGACTTLNPATTWWQGPSPDPWIRNQRMCFADAPSQGLGRGLQPWTGMASPCSLATFAALFLHDAAEVQNVTSTDESVETRERQVEHPDWPVSEPALLVPVPQHLAQSKPR